MEKETANAVEGVDKDDLHILKKNDKAEKIIFDVNCCQFYKYVFNNEETTSSNCRSF